MDKRNFPAGFERALNFTLIDALLGRRSRRFSLGASIPDGSLAYTSRREPVPLSELEQLMVLAAAAGNTGWNYLIMRHARYVPYLSNYAGAGRGRTFPSAAGIHTSEIFFTNDEGVYIFQTRDAPALAERDERGALDPEQVLEAHRVRIRKLTDGRLNLPPPRALLRGPQHLVRQPPRQPVADSRGGPGAASSFLPLLPGAERLLPL